MTKKLYLLDPPTPTNEMLARIYEPLSKLLKHYAQEDSTATNLFEAEISWRWHYGNMSKVLLDLEKVLPEARLVEKDLHKLPYDEVFRIPNTTELLVRAEAGIAGALEASSAVIDRVAVATTTLNDITNNQIHQGITYKNGTYIANPIKRNSAVRWALINSSPQKHVIDAFLKEWRHPRVHELHYYAHGVQDGDARPDIVFTTARSEDDWEKPGNTEFHLSDVLKKMYDIQSFLNWWVEQTRPQVETVLKSLGLS